MTDRPKKNEIIEQYRVHEQDTGSPEVQVALLTERINHLSNHLKTHRKDFCSRRGLFQMVGRRRALLRYLEKNDHDRFEEIKKRLSLR